MGQLPLREAMASCAGSPEASMAACRVCGIKSGPMPPQSHALGPRQRSRVSAMRPVQSLHKCT
jgi:hypothetical protein